MSSNKRNKVDFSTALKAQADKMSPKKATTGNPDERLVATVNGVKTTFLRGDSTDAEWEAQKKAAMAQADEEPVTPAAVDDAEFNEETGTTGGKKRKLPPASTPAQGVRVTNTGAGEKELEPTPIKLDDRSKEYYEEVIRNARQRGVDPSKTVKDIIEMQEVTDEYRAKSNAATRAAMDKIPSVLADAAMAPVRDTAKFVDERILGDKPIIPQGVDMNDFAGHVAGQVGTAAQWVGDALGMPNLSKFGANAIQSGESQMLGSMFPQDQGQAPVGAGVPQAEMGLPPPQPAPMSGAPSAPQGPSITSGFKVFEPDPKLEAAAQKARDAAVVDLETAKAAVSNEHEVQKELITNAAKEQILAAQKAQELADLAAEAKRNSITEAKRYMDASTAMDERAREAASNPVDPNRYWNNKDAGQKAMAVISGALFGWTGQGMQWLQRLDSLVSEDMRVQESDRASKVAGLERSATRLGAAGQQALALGATEAEAHLLERTTRLEGLKSYLDMTAMQLQNSQQGVQAAQMSAQLGQNIAGLKEQGASIAQQRADKRTDISMKQAMMRQEAQIAGAKMAGGGGGKPLTDEATMKVADMINALQTAKGASKEFKQSASGILSKLTSMDPTGSTGASKYEAKRLAVVQLLGKGLEGGKLTDNDIERYNKMIPQAGDLRGAEKWDKLVSEMEQKLSTSIRALGATGHNVQGVAGQAAESMVPAATLKTERPF